jgi:hypothetical protein
MLNPNDAGVPTAVFRAIDRLRADANAMRQLQERIDATLAELGEYRPLLVKRGPKPKFGKPMSAAERVARFRRRQKLEQGSGEG